MNKLNDELRELLGDRYDLDAIEIDIGNNNYIEYREFKNVMHKD